MGSTAPVVVVACDNKISPPRLDSVIYNKNVGAVELLPHCITA